MKDEFTVVNDEGKEFTCVVLFTFENNETGKHYVVYTDNTFDEDGKIQVYAGIYDEDDEDDGDGDFSALYPIKTRREWAIIETILDSLQEEIRSNMNMLRD